MNTASIYHVTETQAQPNIIARFLNWCEAQNHNRLLWLGIILGFHGCILTPITGMIVLALGGHFLLFMFAMLAMAMSLVTNLAAMPTKYTLPIFAFSILIDITLIAVALSLHQ